MRINRSVLVETNRLFLVPYCDFHVPRYHGWMLSETLRHATSSDLLTLNEEYEAQGLWANLDDRLTFILLAREKIRTSDIPSSSSANDNWQQLEIDAMIGDINLVLTPEDETKPVVKDTKFQGEMCVMIAEEGFRGQGLAAEAIAAMLQYSGSHLPVNVTSLVAKVSLDNHSSLRLFRDHLGFIESKRCDVFNQVDLVPPPEAFVSPHSPGSGDHHSCQDANFLASTAKFVVQRLLDRSSTLSTIGWKYCEHDLTTWRSCLLPVV